MPESILSPGFIAEVASFLGLTASDLVGRLKRYRESRKEEAKESERAARAEGAHRIVAERLHINALTALYPKDDLKQAGLCSYSFGLRDREIPTAVVGSPRQLEMAIELGGKNELCNLKSEQIPLEAPDPEIAARILADIEARKLRVWDQPIYRLTAFTSDGSWLNTDFTLDRFMRYRLGIGALWDEMIEALIHEKFDLNALAGKREEVLPLRQQFLGTARKVRDYSARMCAGGIHATVAIQRPRPEDDYVIPVQRRSAILSEGQDTISVVPMAFHQPMIDPYAEVRFSETFYRELYEELFGGEEVTKDSRHLRHDWYMEVSPPLQWLRANAGSCRLLCTGLGFNLASGNYDMAILLVISNPDFWEKFSCMLEANWEISEEITPLISTKDPEALQRILSLPEWVGTGLFSMSRGLRCLKDLDSRRVEIPNIESRVE